MNTKTLSEAEVTVINEKYCLDLSYTDATHYRAAQVIWSLNYLDQHRTQPTIPDREAAPALDTPSADPDPEGIA